VVIESFTSACSTALLKYIDIRKTEAAPVSELLDAKNDRWRYIFALGTVVQWFEFQMKKVHLYTNTSKEGLREELYCILLPPTEITLERFYTHFLVIKFFFRRFFQSFFVCLFVFLCFCPPCNVINLLPMRTVVSTVYVGDDVRVSMDSFSRLDTVQEAGCFVLFVSLSVGWFHSLCT